jgi:hypothetical protein
MLQDETLYMDRDSQIKAIEKTFEDSKKSIDKHYSKPNVVPVEILPVYPDFKVFLHERLIINCTILILLPLIQGIEYSRTGMYGHPNIGPLSLP